MDTNPLGKPDALSPTYTAMPGTRLIDLPDDADQGAEGADLPGVITIGDKYHSSGLS
jgi:hypothetical protein